MVEEPVKNNFANACREANVKPSKRQEKKWKRKVGIAYRVMKGWDKPLPPGHMHQGG